MCLLKVCQYVCLISCVHTRLCLFVTVCVHTVGLVLGPAIGFVVSGLFLSEWVSMDSPPHNLVETDLAWVGAWCVCECVCVRVCILVCLLRVRVCLLMCVCPCMC